MSGTLKPFRRAPGPIADRAAMVFIHGFGGDNRPSVRRDAYPDISAVTLMELAALTDETAVAPILAATRENREPETTARNLAPIREARAADGESVLWAGEIERTLHERAGMG